MPTAALRIDPEFPIDDFTQELRDFRRRYGDCEQRIKNDILRTKRLKNAAQEEADTIVADDKGNANGN